MNPWLPLVLGLGGLCFIVAGACLVQYREDRRRRESTNINVEAADE